MGSIIPGPVPPYSNPPIHPEWFQPGYFYIEDITMGLTTLVETTEDHNYVIGQQIRLIIPQQNGCRELNGITAYVINIPTSTEVLLDISTIGFPSFVTTALANQPQILAIGDANSGQINSNGVLNTLYYIPGSFINISP
jgi:hypothetical protein